MSRSNCPLACRRSNRPAFADHMNRFITGDRAPSSPERPEMLASMHPARDGAVILLEHVIQIRHWPMPAILGQTAFGFELRDGGRIRGVAIGVDHSWCGMVRTAQRFEQK